MNAQIITMEFGPHATADELEEAAAVLVKQANLRRTAYSAEPATDGSVIRWDFAVMVEKNGEIKTRTLVAFKSNGRWWSTRRGERNDGVEWWMLAQEYKQIRDGAFDVVSGWETAVRDEPVGAST